MDLSNKMSVWGFLEKKKMEIEQEIIKEVLGLKNTITVDGVRVSYRKGNRTFDYQATGMNSPQEIIDANTTETKVVDWDGLSQVVEPAILEQFTTVNKSVNWKAVCEQMGVEPKVKSQAEPSVSVKMV